MEEKDESEVLYEEISSRTGKSKRGLAPVSALAKIGDRRRFGPRIAPDSKCSQLRAGDQRKGWMTSQRRAKQRRSLRMGDVFKHLSETMDLKLSLRLASVPMTTHRYWMRYDIDGYRTEIENILRSHVATAESVVLKIMLNDNHPKQLTAALAYLNAHHADYTYRGGKGEEEDIDARELAGEVWRKVIEDAQGWVPVAPGDPMEGAKDVTPKKETADHGENGGNGFAS